MFRNKQTGKARLMTAASILTLALVALPFEPSLDGVAVDGTAAHAKGNGGGHGGGNSGGNRGGNSGRGGADTDSAAGSAAGSGRGHGKAGAPGQNKDGASGFAAAGDIGEEDVAKNYSATASMMGSLNSWFHASANARGHASSNSQVGLAASYEKSLLGDDIETAIESLLAAANKPVSDEIQALTVVQSINAALGITVEGATEETDLVEETKVVEETGLVEETGVVEESGVVEETEVVDTETTETTETVQSRSISQATEDAVVAGFLARDSSLGETEGDGTIDVSETTPKDDGAIGDGSGPDETIPSS